MLGERGDALAVPLVMKAHERSRTRILPLKLSGHWPACRVRRLSTRCISWILKYDSEEGHRAAANALTTILDSTSMVRVAESLPASTGSRYRDTVMAPVMVR
ncbi:MAG: hypothetical protein MZV63_27945 [Marinilabiliales bacterium]|nr:hypothetical protein [Marinilabiliales bacterium]